MKKNIVLPILVFVSVLTYAQSYNDSLIIVGTKWEITNIQKGVIRKHAQIPLLYNGVQNINMIEVDLNKSKCQTKIIVNVPNEIASVSAQNQKAIAAINGSYFNMKDGNSVCFLKVGKQIIDTTTANEFSIRVNGAISINNKRIRIKPWKKEYEKVKYSRKIDILASGPLMINEGKVCDFSMSDQPFIETKHPRSAICITKDNRLILITVDGRSPKQAEGVNIPELTHLLKVLGGKYALNLDGGGSTTLWSKDAPQNGVLNMPSDNKKFDHFGERKVSNLIIIKNK